MKEQKNLKGKNCKGITLIALVVTIVVLLILAGVSISMLTGESGIISQAKNAKEQTEIGKEKEIINIAFTSVKGAKISRGDMRDVTSAELQEEINNYTREATVTGVGILTITYTSGREYEVDGSGNITIMGGSYDGMYNVGELEGQIAPEDLFEYEIIDKQSKTARILRIKAEYCNIDGFNASTDLFELTDTDGDIIYKGEKISDMLVIPYEVTINGTKYKITEANIGVTRRGFYATEKFYYMSFPNVKSIVYPNSIENIESYFDGDNSGDIYYYIDDTRYSMIENIIFSNNIKIISRDMLNNTKWYENQPDGDIYMGKLYYEYKGEMPENTSITLKEGTTAIADKAFYYCENLTNIMIPESVISIGEKAFYRTKWYDNKPDGDLYIGKVYYSYKGEMPENTSITLKEGTTAITGRAFYDCDNLTSITIPDSVTSIGGRAFSYCSSLTSITIPDSVTSIGHYAFYNCSSLTSITIPDSVTSIGHYAFYNCSSLTSITIPDSVTSIGSYAFSWCENLTSITIPDSVTSIGGSAFSSCSRLTNITIPESVTSIGKYTFSGCSSLTNIIIPDSVTSIGSYAFDGTGWYNNQPNGEVYIGKILYKYKGEMPENTNIIVKEGTTAIAESAFLDCSSLTSITIPDGVTSIEGSVFGYCRNLTSITIPNSIKAIRSRAFDYCSSLTSITIPDSVTSIGNEAFEGCSSLTSITIPNSVTIIGYYAFCDCDNLTSITIPDSVTSIEYSTFEGCNNLISITIPDSVTSIEYGAFEDCTSLTSITIPESVTSIGSWAFAGCSSLASITIPNSVTIIENNVFYDCDNLTSINIKKEENSISGAPWGASSNVTVNWNYKGE